MSTTISGVTSEPNSATAARTLAVDQAAALVAGAAAQRAAAQVTADKKANTPCAQEDVDQAAAVKATTASNAAAAALQAAEKAVNLTA